MMCYYLNVQFQGQRVNHLHRDHSTQRTGPPNLLNFPDLAIQYTNRIVLAYAQPFYNLSECLGFFIVLIQTIRRHACPSSRAA